MILLEKSEPKTQINHCFHRNNFRFGIATNFRHISSE
ncbi:hypothetical protein NK6_8931 [Bradyrhizobium diazoefficiens]|uniref:Uncharacterized protein n=1 Tax=Bradyrhizobium diazoefficiens TaxID=1355477 RepID=A0A0E3VX56_9BRAD|nr:hypothetical protein NK6_8931 [Bradyrhizobium diazoefficiens]